jgi:microsomal dipeptidase-like Zn-dependent dipeptidase
MKKKILGTVVAVVGLGLLALRSGAVVRLVDARLNRVVAAGAANATAASRDVHATLGVVDLHADPLLWGRDLHSEGTWGAVDIPRLTRGNVALQVFGVVTRTPITQNMQLNPDFLNTATLIAFANGWPSDVWFSPRALALHQGRTLKDAAAASKGRLAFITTRAQLDALLARRAEGDPVTGALLATEGAFPLEGSLRNLLDLYAAGFRMVGLSHFVDGDVAGSAHGWDKGGLTEFGADVVRRCEDMGITVDLAHASPAAIQDVLKMAHKPLVVSHTGVAATCPGPRNLTDEQIRGVAANGGVMGVGLFEGATCGNNVEATVDAMEHILRLVGVNHVALGSDFDGGVVTPVDASGWAEVTHLLLSRGHGIPEVAAMMGGNALRVLGANLK